VVSFENGTEGVFCRGVEGVIVVAGAEAGVCGFGKDDSVPVARVIDEDAVVTVAGYFVDLAQVPLAVEAIVS
jgi:hypothetical protein